jgi:phenylpropionate dioxygenase-like ring-hydroxylating dioxygenase large terminal subunit
MLVMNHRVFRRFWYPVIPMEHLKTGPQRFELLGQALALFLDEQGVPAAVEDRCCHRSARLSLGKVSAGLIACPYHGWQYRRDGQCVLMPQFPERVPGPSIRVKAFLCQERYGYAWVALEEPLYDIPRIPEAEDRAFAIVHEFYETWNVAGLRVMENELDMAHPGFVHLGTFGSPEHLLPRDTVVQETDGGLTYQCRIGVTTAHHAQQTANERVFDYAWYAPFTVRIRINYADGGPPHLIVNSQVPIANDRTQFVQFCLIEKGRNIDADKVVAFDRAVTLEDKHVLESTDPNVPIDPRGERHMASDEPGIVMRRVLKRIIERDERGAAAE